MTVDKRMHPGWEIQVPTIWSANEMCGIKISQFSCLQSKTKSTSQRAKWLKKNILRDKKLDIYFAVHSCFPSEKRRKKCAEEIEAVGGVFGSSFLSFSQKTLKSVSWKCSFSSQTNTNHFSVLLFSMKTTEISFFLCGSKYLCLIHESFVEMLFRGEKKHKKL